MRLVLDAAAERFQRLHELYGERPEDRPIGRLVREDVRGSRGEFISFVESFFSAPGAPEGYVREVAGEI